MDIVERLRKRKEIIIAANPNGVITQVDRDAIEAADEIERLMDCLEKANQMLIECGEEPLIWFQGKPFRP